MKLSTVRKLVRLRFFQTTRMSSSSENTRFGLSMKSFNSLNSRDVAGIDWLELRISIRSKSITVSPSVALPLDCMGLTYNRRRGKLSTGCQIGGSIGAYSLLTQSNVGRRRWQGKQLLLAVR